MFSLIYCFLPILLLLVHIVLIKRRNSVTWDIKKGQICYHCKESLNLSDDLMFKRLLDTKNYSSLCISCNRDRKIQQIKKPYLIFKFKFLNFIVAKDLSKFNLVYIILVLLLVLSDIFLIFYNIEFRLWLVYGTLNLLYYFFNISKTLYTTTKKPQ